MKTKVITVFGTGRAMPGDENYQLAHDLGSLIGRSGYVLANGGYGGTMEAAALGCAKEAGEVIGVTCSAFGRSGSNQYVSREIEAGSLPERLAKLVELGDAYVVLPGSTGTLLELADVWELKNKGFLAETKPVILLGQFWRPLVELVCVEDPNLADLLTVADSPDEVLEILRNEFSK